jgi:hypothetical protein
MYFVAEATLLRNRWYWRDERVARVSRSWRLAYQPLTGTWRVGLGGLNQNHATLAEALAVVSRSGGWRWPTWRNSTPTPATTSSSATGSTPRSCPARCSSAWAAAATGPWARHAQPARGDRPLSRPDPGPSRP